MGNSVIRIDRGRGIAITASKFTYSFRFKRLSGLKGGQVTVHERLIVHQLFLLQLFAPCSSETKAATYVDEHCLCSRSDYLVEVGFGQPREWYDQALNGEDALEDQYPSSVRIVRVRLIPVLWLKDQKCANLKVKLAYIEEDDCCGMS